MAAIAVAVAAAVTLPTPAARSQWLEQESGARVTLRGVSAATQQIVWASGANGTILYSSDGGASWSPRTIPGTDALDFRDIDAVSESGAYVLSIGPGSSSRIYKTVDAGRSWTLQFTNDNDAAFFDAMAFWNSTSGIAVSDSVDGRFIVMRTRDGGATWRPVPAAGLPPALADEGFFAASGTNVAVSGRDHVWLATGAAKTSRVLRSTDGGDTWQVADTPVASGGTAGAYSIAFRDTRHGVVVGGDYTKETTAGDNVAVTGDGGATWQLVRARGVSGFRSLVAPVPGRATTWIAVGPSGSDLSTDDGRSWAPLGGPGYHTFAFVPGAAVGWGAGASGRLGRLTLP